MVKPPSNPYGTSTPGVFRPSARLKVTRYRVNVISFSVDEEATSLGINHLVAQMTSGKSAYKLLPQPPDIAVVAEPTLLDIVVAHRGAVRWQIHTAGRACHSSRPQDGVNAIYKMAKLVTALEQFAAELPGSKPAHRLCGPATLSVQATKRRIP